MSGGRGIDDPGYFGDDRRRKTARFSALVDRALILDEIDAEGLVGGHIGMDSLNFGGELGQGFVRGVGRAANLGVAQSANARKGAIDYKFSHVCLQFRC